MAVQTQEESGHVRHFSSEKDDDMARIWRVPWGVDATI